MEEFGSQEEMGSRSLAYAMAMPSFEDYMQLKSQNRALRKLIEDLKNDPTKEQYAGLFQENAELKDSNEKLRNRLKENENLLRKAKDLIQNLQADLQLKKLEKPSISEGHLAELNENMQHLQQNNRILEGENKELANMCREKEIELEEYKQENMMLLTQINSDKEKLLSLQQELTVAQNDRINLQEELTQSLLLLEEKGGKAISADIKKKLDKRTIQLKEAREAFGILKDKYDEVEGKLNEVQKKYEKFKKRKSDTGVDNHEKLQEHEEEYQRYRSETEKQAKYLWQKIDVLERQMYFATRYLDKKYRGKSLDPLEAPKDKKPTLKECKTRLESILTKIPLLMKKFAEGVTKRVSSGVFQGILNTVKNFDEKLQKACDAFENYTTQRRPMQVDILEKEATTQRSNYAKLANELIGQSMTVNSQKLGTGAGSEIFIQTQYKLLELEEQYLENFTGLSVELRKLLESSCKALEMAQQKGIDPTSEIGLLKRRNYELAANINESYLNLFKKIEELREYLLKNMAIEPATV